MDSRRSFVKGAAAFLFVALLPLRSIAAKLSKSDVKYQDKPNAGKDCDDCLQFIPGATAKAPGTCKIVDGPVSPHGYCLAFTPRPKQG